MRDLPACTPESIAAAKAACLAERKQVELETGVPLDAEGHPIWPKGRSEPRLTVLEGLDGHALLGLRLGNVMAALGRR